VSAPDRIANLRSRLFRDKRLPEEERRARLRKLSEIEERLL
jgi:hypothetical protein